MGTITINTFLPTRIKFVYSCSIKICALGFDKLLESIFCLLLVVETFSLPSCWDVWRWQIRWIWRMRQNHTAQFVQLLKHWLWGVQSGTVVQKNRALSVDQCWLQALQFSVRLIDLLSILLRCTDFTGIWKAVLDQTGSRPPNSYDDIFLVQVWLGEVLWSFFSVQLLS